MNHSPGECSKDFSPELFPGLSLCRSRKDDGMHSRSHIPLAVIWLPFFRQKADRESHRHYQPCWRGSWARNSIGPLPQSDVASGAGFETPVLLVTSLRDVTNISDYATPHPHRL